MALHSVTQTQNHEFFVEDGGFPAAGFLDSYARDIAGACERNFNKLGALFGTAQRFGPGNQIRVILDVTLSLFGAGAVGQNGGFAEDGGTTIWLAVSGAVFAGRGRDQVLAGIRAAHVAELLEVFLSLRAQDQATLDPGAADGEALSRVFAAELEPVGYQVIGRTSLFGGPNLLPASHWLNETTPSPRPDAVSQTIHSDSDPVAIGCGMLFLHYLHTQLRHSWPDVVSALGSTLQDTSAALGGPNGPFRPFADLLARVFPTGEDYNLSSDNVFPLLDPTRRRVDLDTGDVRSMADGPYATEVKRDSIEVSPALLCPTDLYSYTLYGGNGSTEIRATTTGYGMPQFEWRVEGQPAPTDPFAGGITYEASAWDYDLPSGGSFTSRTARIMVTASVDDGEPHASVLTVALGYKPGVPALANVTVSVDVRERATGDGLQQWTTWSKLKTQTLAWEPRFYADRQRCSDTLREMIKRYTHLQGINLLLTLPDPAPPWVEQSLLLVARLRGEVRIIRHIDPELGELLETRLATLAPMVEP